MSRNDYYIGLDIGTDSVGWAATNADYTLCRFKQKDMWGIRLFEEANTAAERRLFRTGRRRNGRKKERLRIVQEIFAEEIEKVDPEFFLRLNESKYVLSDKMVNTPNIFFNDEDYKDADYFMQYPTIYHLKKALLEGKEIEDIRFLFLVVNHYMKNRGHFLFPSLNAQETTDFMQAFVELQNYLYENFNMELDCKDSVKFQQIIKDPTLGKQVKGKKIIDLTEVKDKQKKKIINMMCGSKVKFADILDPELDADLINQLKDAEIPSISFEDALDDKWEIIESELGDRFELVKRIQAIYDWGILAEILDGEEYLSLAKVKIYKTHGEDLEKLKDIIKKYIPGEYKKFFNDNNTKDNYVAYVGMTKKNGKKLPVKYSCDQNGLCKNVKKILEKIKAVEEEDEEKFNELKEKAENNRLLPKQVSKDNGVIPYQVNEAELKKILENASAEFSFLLEKDESGFSNKEKIEKTFAFKIPYYVGPLVAKEDHQFAWIVRKDYSEKITPWNFDEIVDKKASANNFIRRMTNKCSYLLEEDVVPKNSLLYSKFMVLNELNNLELDGKKITVEEKQKIYEKVFKKYDRVTSKRLRNYLYTQLDYRKDVAISGIDGDFKSNLKSYRDFENILGVNFDESMVEDLILWILLFGDDRSILKEAIEEKFGDRLNKNEIKQIVKLQYSGWGRLSEKMLDGLAVVNTETGEMSTMIDLLWNTNENFMEILYHYNFKKAVEDENDIDKTETLDEIVGRQNLSPTVKRPVLQATKIVNEIAKIKGYAPKKIFVEMARGKTDQGRTKSRKNKLLELYKNCKKDEPELFERLENETDASLRRDRLYLYYTQFGKSMYSGKPLPIESIYNPSVCDVDHIFPQSKIKDDSLDNRVLVLREENAKKGNVYPLPEKVQKKMVGFWSMLRHKDLISEKKLKRLIRRSELTNDELSDFVARQLVSTRQSTKAVARVLQTLYPEQNTEIVYVKAGLVSDFRNGENIWWDGKNGEKPIKFVKCREVNDYHHAKDAYLNIVVGNVYNTKITHNRANFVDALRGNKISMNHIFDYPVKNAWEPGREGSMKTVCKVMKKNNILFTRRAFEKTGGFYKETIMKKGKGQAPIKSKDDRLADIDTYGGYNDVFGAYFCAIEHDKKGKRIRSMEAIPIIYKDEYENDPIKYCVERLGYVNPEIVVKKIKINALMEVDGFRVHVSGRTNDNLIFKPAIQLILSSEWNEYVKNMTKYIDKCKNGFRDSIDECEENFIVKEEYDKISRYKNRELFDLLKDKMTSSIYSIKYKKIGDEISTDQSIEIFENLTPYQQCFTLIELIKMLRCTAEKGNLHYLSKNQKSGTSKGTLTAGMKNYNKKNKSLKIINQSITGLYENRINLM